MQNLSYLSAASRRFCFIIYAATTQNRSQISLHVSTKKCLLTVIYNVICVVIYNVISVSDVPVFTVRETITCFIYSKIIGFRWNCDGGIIEDGSFCGSWYVLESIDLFIVFIPFGVEMKVFVAAVNLLPFAHKIVRFNFV